MGPAKTIQNSPKTKCAKKCVKKHIHKVLFTYCSFYLPTPEPVRFAYGLSLFLTLSSLSTCMFADAALLTRNVGFCTPPAGEKKASLACRPADASCG